MSKKYRITLTPQERKELEELVNRGKVSALKQRHGRILLQADDNQPGGAATNAAIAQAVGVDISTVERVRRVFVFHGLQGSLIRKNPDRHYVRKLDGKAEAQLIALTCDSAPEGHERWSLSLLADRLVELEVVDSISRETVRQTLKKTKLSPGSKSSGA